MKDNCDDRLSLMARVEERCCLKENPTLVLPSCHSFLVLSYLNRRSVLLFLSSPAAATFSFRMILYLQQKWSQLSEKKRGKQPDPQQFKDTNREKKSLKVLRTGNPARRIFTVSSIPEYLSWLRTTSGSKMFGFYVWNNKYYIRLNLMG